jgi:hypothetical protein
VRVMAYATADARRDLLAAIAEATERIGVALSALGAAYEQLDEQSGDRLEEALFRPVQLAYGRARRAHDGFAERYGLAARAFEPAAPGHPSQGVKGFVEAAGEAVAQADQAIADLQDSMLPVEVGDPQLRAELADVRERIASLPDRAHGFVSLFGR